MLRERQAKLQAHTDQSTAKDYDELSNSFGQVNEQANNVVKDLIRINEDLDNRSIELNDYLSKFSDLQGMYKDFDDMLANLDDKHERFQKIILDCELSASKLQKVLSEMEKGVARDYKLKEGLIVKQQHELAKVVALLTEIKIINKQLSPRIATL